MQPATCFERTRSRCKNWITKTKLTNGGLSWIDGFQKLQPRAVTKRRISDWWLTKCSLLEKLLLSISGLPLSLRLLYSQVHPSIVCLENISLTNSQVTRSSAGFVGLMATQSVPIPLITGKTPNSSNYDHGNDNQDYRDDDHEYPDDDKDDQTTMTYRSFPITDCRHAPERAHLPGLESTMCRKVRQKGTKYHSCLSNIKHLDIYTP